MKNLLYYSRSIEKCCIRLQRTQVWQGNTNFLGGKQVLRVNAVSWGMKKH